MPTTISWSASEGTRARSEATDLSKSAPGQCVEGMAVLFGHRPGQGIDVLPPLLIGQPARANRRGLRGSKDHGGKDQEDEDREEGCGKSGAGHSSSFLRRVGRLDRPTSRKTQGTARKLHPSRPSGMGHPAAPLVRAPDLRYHHQAHMPGQKVLLVDGYNVVNRVAELPDEPRRRAPERQEPSRPSGFDLESRASGRRADHRLRRPVPAFGRPRAAHRRGSLHLFPGRPRRGRRAHPLRQRLQREKAGHHRGLGRQQRREQLPGAWRGCPARRVHHDQEVADPRGPRERARAKAGASTRSPKPRSTPSSRRSSGSSVGEEVETVEVEDVGRQRMDHCPAPNSRSSQNPCG